MWTRLLRKCAFLTLLRGKELDGVVYKVRILAAFAFIGPTESAKPIRRGSLSLRCSVACGPARLQFSVLPNQGSRVKAFFQIAAYIPELPSPNQQIELLIQYSHALASAEDWLQDPRGYQNLQILKSMI